VQSVSGLKLGDHQVAFECPSNSAFSKASEPTLSRTTYIFYFHKLLPFYTIDIRIIETHFHLWVPGG